MQNWHTLGEQYTWLAHYFLWLRALIFFIIRWFARLCSSPPALRLLRFAFSIESALGVIPELRQDLKYNLISSSSFCDHRCLLTAGFTTFFGCSLFMLSSESAVSSSSNWTWSSSGSSTWSNWSLKNVFKHVQIALNKERYRELTLQWHILECKIMEEIFP